MLLCSLPVCNKSPGKARVWSFLLPSAPSASQVMEACVAGPTGLTPVSLTFPWPEAASRLRVVLVRFPLLGLEPRAG